MAERKPVKNLAPRLAPKPASPKAGPSEPVTVVLIEPEPMFTVPKFQEPILETFIQAALNAAQAGDIESCHSNLIEALKQARAQRAK